ncbi:MAG: hypothetical protein HOV81_37885 [Kofleriaceae bacterium]|nr:hypothetical protein [Kofleriaceae bacterium]
MTLSWGLALTAVAILVCLVIPGAMFLAGLIASIVLMVTASEQMHESRDDLRSLK